MLVILAVIATGITIFWLHCRYKLSYWKRRGVESLKGDSIFGNFKDAALFRSPPGWHIGDQYKKARSDASYIGFYIFHKPCLLLRDPALIKQILINDFENFSDRHFGGSKQWDSMGMRNLFSLRNPTWKYVRTKISPTLTRNKLKQMLPLMLDIGTSMMEYLKNQPTKQNNAKLVDAQDLNYKYSTDLIATIALGTRTDSFHHAKTEFLIGAQRFFYSFKRMVALVIVFFVPEIMDLFGVNVLFNSSFFKKIFWKAMDNREKTGEKRGDFIDSLIQLKHGEQNPDYKFEGNNLLYQASSFFSGFESSSTCVSFTLMELAGHPEYQKLARKDINRAIDKHGWTYEAIYDMKYLDQVIAENLRLHPPVSTVDRYAFRDYNIPGTDIVIEKGTPIFISLYGLGTDPKFWDEPEVYNPNRFAEGNTITDAYIPFGVGPRMCIGIKVGQLHAKVVLAMLLRNYKIWQSEGHKSVLNPRSTFTATIDGINLYFRKIVQ